MLLTQLMEKQRHNQKLQSTNDDSLLIQKLLNIVPDLVQSGQSLTAENISKYLDVSPARAKHLYNIMQQKNMIPQSKSVETSDPVSLLVMDRYRAAQVFNHNKTAKPSKRVDYLKGGAVEVAKRTGLTVDQVIDTATNHWDEIQTRCQQLAIDVKPSFFAKENKFSNQLTSYDPEKETPQQAILRVVSELTDGFNSKYYGQIPASTIEQKLGGALSRRTIDKYMSEDPQLKKLEHFRPIGKRAGVTDQDRELSYLRTMQQRASANDV